MSRQTEYFAIIPEWVLFSGISPRALQLYAVLDRHGDKDGASYPSLTRLGELMDCKPGTVRTARAELVELGALEVRERARPDGGQTSNGYLLYRDPPSMRCTPPSEKSKGAAPEILKGQEEPESFEPEREASPSAQPLVDRASEPPALVKVDGRNLAFDALVEVCELAERSPRKREVGVALGGRGTAAQPGIRKLFWDEVCDEAARRGLDGLPDAGEGWERALAAAIHQRGALYREALPQATLTPLALAKWWTDVPRESERAAHNRRHRGLTPEEIRRGGV
jgi:hypothetical protein